MRSNDFHRITDLHIKYYALLPKIKDTDTIRSCTYISYIKYKI